MCLPQRLTNGCAGRAGDLGRQVGKAAGGGNDLHERMDIDLPAAGYWCSRRARCHALADQALKRSSHCGAVMLSARAALIAMLRTSLGMAFSVHGLIASVVPINTAASSSVPLVPSPTC